MAGEGAEFAGLKMSQPAHRALEAAGIRTWKQLASHTEREVLALHGMGPKAMSELKPALEAEGLRFREGR